jgi:hypothetical protein
LFGSDNRRRQNQARRKQIAIAVQRHGAKVPFRALLCAHVHMRALPALRTRAAIKEMARAFHRKTFVSVSTAQTSATARAVKTAIAAIAVSGGSFLIVLFFCEVQSTL